MIGNQWIIILILENSLKEFIYPPLQTVDLTILAKFLLKIEAKVQLIAIS